MISAFSIDHFLTNESSRNSVDLLFHYTGRASLRAILESGNMWLNTLDKMNDPRERKEWVADQLVFPPGGMSPQSLGRQHDLQSTIDVMLRRGARVACLTADRAPCDGATPNSHFHRGWGRARMWEQYAERHQGAVLVFDRASFFESLDASRPPGGHARAMGHVHYLDRPLELPLVGSISSMEELQTALEDVTSDGKALGDLFFVKNSDWSGENEVRFVLVLEMESATSEFDKPLDLSYGDSLRAVVLGEKWDGADWLPDATRKQNLAVDNVVICDWVNGAPVLRPYYPIAGRDRIGDADRI